MHPVCTSSFIQHSEFIFFDNNTKTSTPRWLFHQNRAILQLSWEIFSLNLTLKLFPWLKLLVELFADSAIIVKYEYKISSNTLVTTIDRKLYINVGYMKTFIQDKSRRTCQFV
ncbi:unnamed protein product [Hermetia illucens]|uniref:Uncharacterized protein n=1 Tax=Hermetia illucens TaxID=343691 RepID=A0A7R8UKX7_HERIL|nr:unnamed protein product [Hermetia illucens]